MKRPALLVLGGICLVGLVLVWNTRGNLALRSSNETEEVAPTSPDQLASRQEVLKNASGRIELNRQALVSLTAGGQLPPYSQPAPTNTPAHLSPAQPTNTPAPPVEYNRTTYIRFPSPGLKDATAKDAHAGMPTEEQKVQNYEHAQGALKRAQALREAGVRFPVANPGTTTARPASPWSTSATCLDMLLNPQMDVIEFGDGTGTVDYWTILRQSIYFDNRPGYYQSPFHSLAMADELDGSDPDVDDSTLDIDHFGQGFRAPLGLTYLKIWYSRLYENSNTGDEAYSNLWTLDDGGYLEELIDFRSIGESPDGWSNRYWELDSSLFDQVSGKPLAVTFDMWSDRTGLPSELLDEIIWLDDAQVTLCYDPPDYQVFLPHTVRQPAQTRPACSPIEPDGVSQRGYIDVGACCNGSFSATDLKDYYTLNLKGVTNIRLGLRDLPPGTNWDALIFEDTGGYPLKCHIGTPGSNDKWADCLNLSLSKDYFVLVNTASAPDIHDNTYTLCVLPK